MIRGLTLRRAEDAADLTDALLAREAARDSLPPPMFSAVVVTSDDHAAQLGQLVVCKQALTIMLPRARAENVGAIVWAKLVTAGNVTVDPGSATIDGSSGAASLAVTNGSALYVVIGDDEWATLTFKTV